MIFGTGDIGFNSGSYLDDNGVIGAIVFYNQEPRTIGDVGDIRAGVTVDLEDFPIIMKFTRVESIDVLIESLLVAKEQINKNSKK